MCGHVWGAFSANVRQCLCVREILAPPTTSPQVSAHRTGTHYHTVSRNDPAKVSFKG